MRERAAAIGGSLEVVSEPQAGTNVRLRAPAAAGAHMANDPKEQL